MEFTKESEFKIDELFFSRTDKRGVILSCNSVFKRVSGYDWEDLLGKAHNVIRHPFMPRAVFYLFWEYLKAGKQVGSYVVNKSKDGGYYWVYAVATPLPGGEYLSIRLKPTSSNLPIVKNVYEKIRNIELSEKPQPKESAELLLQEIKNLGFETYEDFMTDALVKETLSRDTFLNSLSIDIKALNEIVSISIHLQKLCEDIFKSYQQSKFVPLNLEALSSKLSNSGGPISVISNQYDGVSKDIQKKIEIFKDMAKNIQKTLSHSQYSICEAITFREQFDKFLSEPKDSPINTDEEQKILRELVSNRFEKVLEEVNEIIKATSDFKQTYEDIRKETTTLEIISLTGRIEASKLPHAGDILTLLNELNAFKEKLKSTLSTLGEMNGEIFSKLSKIKEEIHKAS